MNKFRCLSVTGIGDPRANDVRIYLHVTPKSPMPVTERHRNLFTTSLLQIAASRAGILTCCPSPTPFGLGLGPPNPGTTSVAQETLGLRRMGFSPIFLLLMPTFSLPCAPRALTGRASRQQGMILYRCRLTPTALTFGTPLSPAYFRRRAARPVSCYAIFKGWLLLSQPPGCVSCPTTFATER